MPKTKWFKKMFEKNEAIAASQAAEASGKKKAGRPRHAPGMSDNVFASDSPVSDPAHDRFKRFNFARRVAGTISSRIDPSSLVVAIFGAWGEGKTTVLNFIESELKKDPNIICVRFNPWRFSDETHLLQNFFKTLSDSLGRCASSYKEKIGKWFAHYASILAPVSVSMPFFFEISPGEGLKNIAHALSSVELDELRQRIENFLNEEGKRVVVLMDDIDRLDRTEIQNIFKLVKLSADFSHTAYVLAFDENMVSAALGERYGNGNVDAGHSFLEKIVQVPLYLPAADKLSLRKFFFDCVDEVLRETQVRLSEEQAQAFVIHFVYGIESRLQTPRIAKCYRNVLGFSLPILKGNVNHVDLMLIEGVRVFYPKLYDVIRENADVFLGSRFNSFLNYEQAVRQKTLDIINRGFIGLTNEETEAARYTLKILFPKLCGIFDNFHYGVEWEEKWTREMRICSEECFGRYFSYAVADDELSEPEIDAFIEKISGLDVNSMKDELSWILERKSPEKLILKLMRKEKRFAEPDVKNLAVAVSKLGGCFTRPKTLFSFTTAFSQAGILVGQLIRNIKSVRERCAAARAVITAGEPLSFALECFKWFRTTDEKGEPNRIFTIEDENDLAGNMLARIKDDSAKSPLYLTFPDDASGLLEFWARFSSVEETSNYIASSFYGKPDNVFGFLRCYLDPVFSGAEAFYGFENPDCERYNAIARVVDPEFIHNALYQVYGLQLKSIDSIVSEEDRLAYQFLNAYGAFGLKD